MLKLIYGMNLNYDAANFELLKFKQNICTMSSRDNGTFLAIAESEKVYKIKDFFYPWKLSKFWNSVTNLNSIASYLPKALQTSQFAL